MNKNTNLKLILASQSPRRKDLLTEAGFHFTILPVNISETPDKNLNLDQQILKIARDKAEACIEVHNHLKTMSYLVLSADTMVIVDQQPFGKPETKDEARRFLRLLSNRSHEVKTAICLINCLNFEHAETLTTSRVHFRKLSEQEIEEYILTGEPMDKAGAYGIQGLGRTFIDRVDGSFDNVIGLSISMFKTMLTERGWCVDSK